jgi:hypothetical protein
MSKTPLTDHYTKRLRNLCDDEFVPIEFARKLERELVAVTEQRDRLAELLRKLDMTLEAQCFSPTGYTRTEIHEALAAVKGDQP